MMGMKEEQKDLFSYQVDLDRRVRQDHPLRKVREAIDFTFVRQEVADRYGYNGNVSVDPAVVLKMMFLLFYDNVASERELMRIIAERLDYLWILGYGLDDTIPDHSVLSKARKRWGVAVFESLFTGIVGQCVAAGLVDGKKIHVDASLIEANASKDSVVKGSAEWIAALKRAYQATESKLEDTTTPDSRVGRITYALCVALTACYVQFGLFRPNAPLWGLILCAPLVPLIDAWLPGPRYEWPGPSPDNRPPPHTASGAEFVTHPTTTEVFMKRWLLAVLTLTAGLFLWTGEALAFCGFYVGKVDTKLFNKASEVAIARHDDKTVITMANDFTGDAKEFALVVPVPTILKKEQIHVGDAAVLAHLADYSAPRLVEYFDENPCRREELMERRSMDAMKSLAPAAASPRTRDKALGITIEAQYTVGEYDILILSAKESAGLETWLTEHDYKIPNGASPVLRSYLTQGMKFFVAKVNLGEQAKLGLTHIRRLQIAFESPKFMLPIRLGTVNADGAQELFIYLLTKLGRVETTNYRIVCVPEAQEVPLYVKDRFGDFYRDLFSQQVRRA